MNHFQNPNQKREGQKQSSFAFAFLLMFEESYMQQMQIVLQKYHSIAVFGKNVVLVSLAHQHSVILIISLFLASRQ